MVASHPDFLSQVLSHGFGEESAGKPGRISHTRWYHCDITPTVFKGNDTTV